MELGHKAVTAPGIATQLWQALRHVASVPAVAEAEPSLAERLGYGDAPAIMIGTDRAGLVLRPWMRDAGFRMKSVGELATTITRLCHCPDQASLAMVSIDGFGGIIETIEPLRQLRECAPHLPLIVMSAEVEGSDFSTERLALCDVTLKTPVGPAALRRALIDAKDNNAVWQARVRDLRQAH